MNKGKSLFYTAKFVLCGIICIAIILSLGLGLSYVIKKRSDSTPTVSPKNDAPVLIIDAGHGGEDAGAIAFDGTLEKDLNLKIASLVKVLCDLNGTNAVMTRDDDRLLYDHYGDLDDYTGQKKLYDLKNRVKITKEHESPVYLGIHMNKFTQEKYSGVQVYYSKNSDKSEIFARSIQNSAKRFLQKDNNRTVKSAGSSIYVLHSLDCPAVLVECGFLSNEKELENLKNEDYQAQLALILFTSSLFQLG